MFGKLSYNHIFFLGKLSEIPSTPSTPLQPPNTTRRRRAASLSLPSDSRGCGNHTSMKRLADPWGVEGVEGVDGVWETFL